MFSGEMSSFMERVNLLTIDTSLFLQLTFADFLSYFRSGPQTPKVCRAQVENDSSSRGCLFSSIWVTTPGQECNKQLFFKKAGSWQLPVSWTQDTVFLGGCQYFVLEQHLSSYLSHSSAWSTSTSWIERCGQLRHVSAEILYVSLSGDDSWRSGLEKQWRVEK